jgi:hypothetical protein
MAQSYRAITTLKLFDDVPFINNQVLTSEAVVLRNIGKQGYFSLEYFISDSGEINFDYLASSLIDGTYINPADADPIEDAAVDHGFQSFGPMISPFMKIRCTCTNNGRLTLFLNVA